MRIYGFGVTSVIAGVLVAGSAFATQVPINTGADGASGNGEPTLYQIAGGDNAQNKILINNLNDNSTQTNSAHWTTGAIESSNTKLFATWTANYGNASFGIYDPTNTSTKLMLLGGGSQIGNADAGVKGQLNTDAPGLFTTAQYDSATHIYDINPQTAQFGSDVFGFYLTIGGNTFYSDPSLNSGDKNRVVGYEGDNSGSFLANEYLFGWEDGTDNDYQDYVVGIESIRPVPEPSSLMLFGLGLVGIGFATRRLRGKR